MFDQFYTAASIVLALWVAAKVWWAIWFLWRWRRVVMWLGVPLLLIIGGSVYASYIHAGAAPSPSDAISISCSQADLAASSAWAWAGSLPPLARGAAWGIIVVGYLVAACLALFVISSVAWCLLRITIIKRCADCGKFAALDDRQTVRRNGKRTVIHDHMGCAFYGGRKETT